ncbi:hypothetical protein KGM_214486 [Danaus plexippus plexippus]|uniref:Uncharacterized protein n=1 Tax=Danaus plexippus plexippus TaxID=278856 RepID=A0A212F4T7_DANPL|nr:hypothetical protein KGM_214486 [Danaus plexippus plexippus]
MYTTWYSRGEGGMHHHQMGQLYHGAPMIKTEAGVNSDCMMAVDYAPPIKRIINISINIGVMSVESDFDLLYLSCAAPQVATVQ